MSRFAGALILAVGIAPAAALASEACEPAPVSDQKQAICHAVQYFEREWPSADWALFRPEATKGDSSWLVQFLHRQPGMRGGGGELRVDIQTGEISDVLGYR